MKLRTLLYALLIGMISLVYACSSDTEQTQKQTVDTTIYEKNGDVLNQSDIDFKMAELVKEKHLKDSTFTEVTSSEYGRGNIVCRNRNMSLYADTGGSYGQASGCMYSNGILYSFTWTEAHYETFADGIGIRWVPAKSVYTVNSSCSCK